jgi:phage-related protein
MEFSIEFYVSRTGAVPVQEFLEELRQSDPGDHAAVLRGLAKLRDRQYHRAPLSKTIGGGLFELRPVGKLNTRVLWFFIKSRRIIAVHGIRSKSQAIPARDLKTARARMRDWQALAQKENFVFARATSLAGSEATLRSGRGGASCPPAMRGVTGRAAYIASLLSRLFRTHIWVRWACVLHQARRQALHAPRMLVRILM